MRRRTVCESSARTCSTLCVREGERGDAEGDAGDEDDVSVAGEEAAGEVGEDGVGRQGDDELLGDGNGLVSPRSVKGTIRNYHCRATPFRSNSDDLEGDLLVNHNDQT